jgi:hypothetical protein
VASFGEMECIRCIGPGPDLADTNIQILQLNKPSEPCPFDS